jgi:hypothetical protein
MEKAATQGTAVEMRWRTLLLVGLSLSIGWGIRGNFGHEYGAAIPGAMAAMAAVLLSQREDWLQRIPYFAMFGAIGWAFGGSISYMVVIAYTHSGHAPSVLYGFACLFVIGFLWGAIGGAGTALPAFLSRERLAEFFVPLTALFLAWWADGVLEHRFIDANPAFHGRSPLDWYDTNWPAALLAILVVLARGAIRRRLDSAERLILSMAVGWWLGFLILTVGLGLRMTPPRSDNWAGSVGMTLGMLLYFQRYHLHGVTFASLVTGFVGGLGFASATLFKLIEMKSGLNTNWHSILEQTYGLLNGLGVAVAMELLRTRAPRVSDDPPVHRWTEAFAVSFVLLLLTYLNLQKEVNDWIGAKAIPETMYFLTTRGWFDLFYALTALAFLWLLREHLRRPLPLIPKTWLGKGQMLYLAFLWWMVVGNFLKAIVAFAPQRLVTEGTIYVNALLCTLIVLLWARDAHRLEGEPSTDYTPLLKRALAAGLAIMLLSVFVDWGIVRALYGDTFAGNAGLHIRFGPNATSNKKK